uniref:Ovule protein n=1 Tax=Romanomermis culicivorax TaxID=13658 RepID=A0A915KGK4_ROMCU
MLTKSIIPELKHATRWTSSALPPRQKPITFPQYKQLIKLSAPFPINSKPNNYVFNAKSKSK